MEELLRSLWHPLPFPLGEGLLLPAVYLLAVSLLSVGFTLWDKRAAIAGKRRVPERTLLLLALLGGSAAGYLTMLCIRHKTLHRRFMIGLPLILVCQMALVIAFRLAASS